MRVPNYRTPLRADHLLLMRIPQRHWDAAFSGIKHENVRNNVERFLRRLDDHLDNGDGLLFYGSNGTGKTSAAVVIAKEARRRGAPVLFATAEDLRVASIEGTLFHEDMTMMDRAREVDVLVIDDLGKDHSGATRYSETLFENLIRFRSSNRRTTILTTNLNQHALQDRFKASMMDVIKEAMSPVAAEGESLREGKVLAVG
jgi:DNA replication protein DnaC